MGRLILALALAVLLATVVVACGGSTSDASSTAPAPVATEATPADATTPAETSTPAGPSSSEVAKLFADNCARCHGADGGGGSAPSITGEDNVDRVKAQIESGGDGMPAFSGQLPPGQIDALAQYVAGGLE
jgi:cytochrome c551